MTTAERAEFIRLRDERQIDDEVLDEVLHHLDLEEAMLSRDEWDAQGRGRATPAPARRSPADRAWDVHRRLRRAESKCAIPFRERPRP